MHTLWGVIFNRKSNLIQWLRDWDRDIARFQNVLFINKWAPGWPLRDKSYLNWPQLATPQTYSTVKYIYMRHQEKNLRVGKLQEGPFQNLWLWEIVFFKHFFHVFFIFWPIKLFFQIKKNHINKSSYFFIT
jgi:hypothetical protein